MIRIMNIPECKLHKIHHRCYITASSGPVKHTNILKKNRIKKERTSAKGKTLG
jgi:hypothetical protein